MSNWEDDIFPLHIYESREEIAPVTTCLSSSLHRDQFKPEGERVSFEHYCMARS